MTEPATGGAFQRRRLLRSHDPEEVRAHLDAMRYRFELAPRDADQLDFCINAVILGNIVLGYDHFGAQVEIQTAPIYGDYTLLLPVHGHVELVSGKHSIVCDPRRAGVLSPTRDHLFRSQIGAAKVHLRLTGRVLHQQLVALLGEPFGAPLEFSPEMSLTEGLGRKLAGYLRLALAHFLDSGSLLWSSTTVSAFEEFIISELLLSHPHNYTEALRRLERPIVPRDVRRVTEYMKAHLRSPVTLPEIVQVSGFPGRTLFKHFRDYLGVSPMRYLRDIRLDEVRKALLQAERKEGVAAIAMRWGFDHMGRFSSYYRKRYGESPSQTLRKPRKRLVGL
jgi:AraC-like DNA-binding protein